MSESHMLGVGVWQRFQINNTNTEINICVFVPMQSQRVKIVTQRGSVHIRQNVGLSLTRKGSWSVHFGVSRISSAFEAAADRRSSMVLEPTHILPFKEIESLGLTMSLAWKPPFRASS
jgi:hypothetical protein